jgi:glycosyltransferase involved in cell wall biosynthesis
MRPKLSVITPSLNQGAYIERTISSVLDQGYENLEYLIVDGGSDDATVEIIRRYEDRVAWWVSEADDGQTDAINKGLKRATGDIVAYINSDDYYLPGAFDTAVAALEESEALWLAGAARFEDAERGLIEVWRPQPPQAAESAIAGRQWWMLAPWSVPQPATFWRREVFDEFGLFRLDMHHAFDTEHSLRLAYAGAMPELTDAELAVRFLHDEAKSADFEPFARDLEHAIRIFTPQLTAGERRRLALIKALRAIGVFRAWDAIRAAGVRIGPHLPRFLRVSERRRQRNAS